jgi:hypothetical protein
MLRSQEKTDGGLEMNFYYAVAAVAFAAAAVTVIQVIAMYRSELKEARHTVKVYATLISKIERFSELRLSLVWNPLTQQWQVIDSRERNSTELFGAEVMGGGLSARKGTPQAVLAVGKHWSEAMQAAVYAVEPARPTAQEQATSKERIARPPASFLS